MGVREYRKEIQQIKPTLLKTGPLVDSYVLKNA